VLGSLSGAVGAGSGQLTAAPDTTQPGAGTANAAAAQAAAAAPTGITPPITGGAGMVPRLATGTTAALHRGSTLSWASVRVGARQTRTVPVRGGGCGVGGVGVGVGVAVVNVQANVTAELG